MIISCLIEGTSIHSTARICGVIKINLPGPFRTEGERGEAGGDVLAGGRGEWERGGLVVDGWWGLAIWFILFAAEILR